MKPTLTRNAQFNFEKPKNWDANRHGSCGDLQVRVEPFAKETLEFFSTWKPSDEERKLIAEGGVIEIGICGRGQPPMQVGVVAPVDPRLEPYLSKQGTADDRS